MNVNPKDAELLPDKLGNLFNNLTVLYITVCLLYSRIYQLVKNVCRLKTAPDPV